MRYLPLALIPLFAGSLACAQPPGSAPNATAQQRCDGANCPVPLTRANARPQPFVPSLLQLPSPIETDCRTLPTPIERDQCVSQKLATA